MKVSTKVVVLGLASVAFFTSCNTTIGLARDMRVLSNEMEKKAGETYNGSAGGAEYSDHGGNYSGAAPVY